VAQGDLTQRAPPWGADEIGQLSTAFNRMIVDVAQAQAVMLRRQRELTALNAIAGAVNTPMPLANTLERVLLAMLDTLGFPAGWVFLFDQTGRRIQLSRSLGLPAEVVAREVHAGLSGCPCIAALRDQRAVVLRPLPIGCALRAGRLADGQSVAAHVTIPIRVRARVLGVLGIASADAGAFGADDTNLLEAIGQQLGVAIENARLWDELREKERVRGQLLEQVIGAQEEERKRVARELHDDTGQAITSLMVGLRAASENCEPTARNQFAALREIAAQTLESVKRMARELRPALLDDLGLAAALERYVSAYRANTGLNADLQVAGFDGPERLPPEVELTTYRIIQEALTNIVKHAQARNVSIVVERKPASLVAIVEDDGRGFDVRSVQAATQEEGRLGLHGMRERAQLIGGRLQLESTPGAGSSVFVEIPL
jgi:signal transduction histidine kinase